MQNERINASTSMLASIGVVACLCWASTTIAQLPPSAPTPPTLTETSIKPASTTPVPSQPPQPTVVTIDPNLLVLKAIYQSVWGPPHACKVYQSSHAFDQQVIVSGEYKSSGLGTGQFRYTARVSSGETTLDTVQVSDGRLMYTQVGLDESPRRVNLDKIRQSIGNAIHQSGERPEVSLFLAVGGQPELLRNLYHRYFWYKAVTGQIRGIDVWQLVGRLRTERPKIYGNSSLDTQNMGIPEPSSNLPTEVRLTLGRSASAAYFPYMIEYFRRIKRQDGQPDSIELLSVLEHSEFNTAVTILDKDFVFNGQAVGKIDDETQIYVPTETIAGQTLVPFMQPAVSDVAIRP